MNVRLLSAPLPLLSFIKYIYIVMIKVSNSTDFTLRTEGMDEQMEQRFLNPHVCTKIESSLSAGYLVGLHTVKNKHFPNYRKAREQYKGWEQYNAWEQYKNELQYYHFEN